MKHKIYSIVLLLGFVVVIASSCERDDICAETTPTTPHLIIRFYDIANPDEIKTVRRLSVRGLDDSGTAMLNIYENRDLDSIMLPLRFQNENESSISRFELERDADFGLDTLDTTESNIDIITVSYTPEFIYVSRACGYKSIFNDLTVSIDNDTDNWILSSEILTTTIENETSAHVILRH